MTTRTSVNPFLARRSPSTLRLAALALHQSSAAMTTCFGTAERARSVARTAGMPARASSVLIWGCSTLGAAASAWGKLACDFAPLLIPGTSSHSYPSELRTMLGRVQRVCSCVSNVVDPVLCGPTKRRQVLPWLGVTAAAIVDRRRDSSVPMLMRCFSAHLGSPAVRPRHLLRLRRCRRPQVPRPVPGDGVHVGVGGHGSAYQHSCSRNDIPGTVAAGYIHARECRFPGRAGIDRSRVRRAAGVVWERGRGACVSQ
eukprot:scaffold4538_cov410-Prasinococcus_capsulatus_cf.AAC.9